MDADTIQERKEGRKCSAASTSSRKRRSETSPVVPGRILQDLRRDVPPAVKRAKLCCPPGLRYHACSQNLI